MPAILNEAVPATTQNVDAEIQATLKSANKYTGWLDKNISLKHCIMSSQIQIFDLIFTLYKIILFKHSKWYSENVFW